MSSIQKTLLRADLNFNKAANGLRDEPPSGGGGNCIYAVFRAKRPSGAKPEGGRLD